MRYDYIERLIVGTRTEIEKGMNERYADMREKYPECINGEYLDANLLCAVVEKDVLQYAEIDFDILIETVERVAFEQLMDMHEVTTEYLETVAEILKSLKESTRGKCENKEICS